MSGDTTLSKIIVYIAQAAQSGNLQAAGNPLCFNRARSVGEKKAAAAEQAPSGEPLADGECGVRQGRIGPERGGGDVVGLWGFD